MKHCEAQERSGICKWFEVPQREDHFDYSYDGVTRSIKFSLERLELERIDISYIHDLCIFTHGSRQDSDNGISEFSGKKGYEAMLSLRNQGVVLAICAGTNE